MFKLKTLGQPKLAPMSGKNSDTTTDKLVKKALNGDRNALNELCDHIGKNVLFRVQCIVVNKEDAEDVSQEVLIRICENIEKLTEPKAFKVWTSRIVINEANRYFAKSRKHDLSVDIDDYQDVIVEESNDFLPQNYVENEEFRKTVIEIIETLPLRQREAVVLHYYDGLNVTQVADVMDISKQNASKYIALARTKIKNELEKKSYVSYSISGVAGAVPIGLLMNAVLTYEASVLAYSGISVATAVTSKRTFWLRRSAVCTAVAAACVFAGIMFFSESHCPPPTSMTQPIATGGGIGFSGGVSIAGDVVHINPGYAKPFLENICGEVTILNWWIVESRSDDVLYEGEGSTLGNTLLELQVYGIDGEHSIYFRVEDEAGSIHRVGRNFYISSSRAE